MGCFNPATKKWVTVAKCGNGHDDKMIEKIQKQLKVKKIKRVRIFLHLTFSQDWYKKSDFLDLWASRTQLSEFSKSEFTY